MDTVIRKLLAMLSPGPGRSPAAPSWAPQGYETHVVHLENGKRYELVIDAGTSDPIARAYRDGHRANDYLTDQLGVFLAPGSWVLDLGAHIGTFSLEMAANGCRVLAVDASPKHVDLLRRSAEANGFGALHVEHVAIGERHGGTVRFHLAGLWGMVETPGLMPCEVQGAPLVEVRATTGDRLLRKVGCKRLDFIKMDVEGSEVAALRGLKRHLTRDDAPVIVYECNGLTLPQYGYSTADLVGLLESYGYRTYRMEGGRLPLYRAHDFQPEAYIDVVALKPRHERRIGRDIAPPLDTEEVIARSLREARMPHEVQRGYIARALEHAGPEFLRDPRVKDALDQLARDPHERVRQAAQWWSARHARAA